MGNIQQKFTEEGSTVTKEYFYRYSGLSFHANIKPFFKDFHKLAMKGDYEYPLHEHKNYELIIVKETSYYCLLNDIELIVSPGEFLIIKPGDIHQDHLRDKQLHYVLHFLLNSDSSGNQSNVRIFADKISPEQQIGKCDTQISMTFLDQLESESEIADAYSTYIQDSILETFLWKILRTLSSDIISEYLTGLSRNRENELKLKSIFEKYHNINLTVPELAKHMGMSKRSLSYFCQKVMGISPAKAITSYRLSYAAELLLNSDLPVKSISGELGFINQFHFSRIFKKFYGVSPTVYRNNTASNYK